MQPYAAAIVLLAVSAGIGWLTGAAGAAVMLRRAERGSSPVDVPDDRRLHTHPTPRGGGIGIFAGVVALMPFALWCGGPGERRLIAVVALAWALPSGLLGWIDDHRPLRVAVKLCVQIAFATIAVALGLQLETLSVPPFGALALGWAAGPVSVLWLVWMTNLFNFMDGMDALAAGSATIFLCGFAALALAAGALGSAAFALGLAAACLGFLRYNWPPARIFMGDAGSLAAGATLGGLAIALTSRDIAGVPVLLPVVIMAVFVFDATFTAVRNASSGVGRLVQPHRRHIYQRLVLAGWPQRSVRGVYFGLSAGCAVAAVAFPVLDPRVQAAALGLILGACIALAIAAGHPE